MITKEGKELKTFLQRKIVEVKRDVSVSRPPKGMCLVTNIYVNPETGKLVVEYDDTSIP